MLQNDKYYLITTTEWFLAPDGEQYRAVWGKCKLLTTEDIFSFKPSRPSTNWFANVGNDDKSMIVAGCQIHYAIRCDERPLEKLPKIGKETNQKEVDNKIYFTE